MLPTQFSGTGSDATRSPTSWAQAPLTGGVGSLPVGRKSETSIIASSQSKDFSLPPWRKQGTHAPGIKKAPPRAEEPPTSWLRFGVIEGLPAECTSVWLIALLVSVSDCQPKTWVREQRDPPCCPTSCSYSSMVFVTFTLWSSPTPIYFLLTSDVQQAP